MKNKYSFLVIALLSSFCLSGQVTNYALTLTPQGSVNYRTTPALDNLTSYTLQFFTNPTNWTKGSVIYSRGSDNDGFSASLENANQIVFKAGNNSFSLSNASLQANSWNQISLVCEENKVKVYLNGTLVQTENISFAIPASSSNFVMGGNSFEGRIDEFRIFASAITDPFFLLWRNTVNKFHPQWNDLIVYYKFDQELCPNVVDYKFNYHGIFSVTGATRTAVTDNEKFKYRLFCGYTNIERWCDKQIENDRYLLTNDLIILNANVDANGTTTIPFFFDEAKFTHVEQIDSWEGRRGVMNFKGAGAEMNVGTNILDERMEDHVRGSVDKYSFATWIYIDQWVEGAYIIKKEASENVGFSVRLGDYNDKKRVLIRTNGVEYSFINKLDVGSWIHLGISANSNTNNQVYAVFVNGDISYASNRVQGETNNYKLRGLNNTPTLIGVNLNGKLDETFIWDESRASDFMRSLMQQPPSFPSETNKMEATQMWPCAGYWDYDNAEQPGYDKYSMRYFVSIMKSATKGYRGQRVRGSFHSFEGWENAFTSDTFRKKFAAGVAEAAKDFDGIDLDFEWCYSDNCWDNYGKTIEAIKAVFPAGKMLTVTPHWVSYRLPIKYMGHVDAALFQMYGPSKDLFQWNTYQNAANVFKNWGYPANKIVLSFANTTSRAYDSKDQAITNLAPVGINPYLLQDTNYTRDKDYFMLNGYKRYITGYDQVIKRCELIQDRDFAGIMYWDMGNDLKSSHPMSFIRAGNYVISSNVDTLITQVNMTPSSLISTKKEEPEMKVIIDNSSNTISLLMPQGQTAKTVTIINSLSKVVFMVQNIPSQTPFTFEDGDGYYIVTATDETNKTYSTPILLKTKN